MFTGPLGHGVAMPSPFWTVSSGVSVGLRGSTTMVAAQHPLNVISITVTSYWVRWPFKSTASRVYLTVYSGADKKHHNSASLAFVRGIRRWSVNSPHKWPATRKMFPFDDVIMSKKGTEAQSISYQDIVHIKRTNSLYTLISSLLCHDMWNAWLIDQKIRYDQLICISW